MVLYITIATTSASLWVLKFVSFPLSIILIPVVILMVVVIYGRYLDDSE